MPVFAESAIIFPESAIIFPITFSLPYLGFETSAGDSFPAPNISGKLVSNYQAEPLLYISN